MEGEKAVNPQIQIIFSATKYNSHFRVFIAESDTVLHRPDAPTRTKSGTLIVCFQKPIEI